MSDPSPASILAYHLYLTFPPFSLINFRPSQNPPPLSPPIHDHNLAHPFTISPQIYHNALSFVWPVTIALLYATTVTYVNKLNVKRNYEPWAFSKTTAFFILVVSHNVFLALYSGWTFIGMANAFRASWPGLRNGYGAAGVADSLCKLHGPRVLGSAATYSPENGSWGIRDVTMKLAGGLPDTTDVGRLWNSGLAFYGWLFYLSKFYEVIDTAIVLTKGKKSSFLQTYHHTGAMFAMWSGIRYMSPPIWMFTLINSFIHTFMYSYYTLAAFGTRVHPMVKRTLTSAQIFQIVFGASYAFAHLFIAYDIPSYSSFLHQNSLSTALPSAFDAVSAAINTAPGEFRNVLKKAALRAAGQEGLAANVRNDRGETFGLDAAHAAEAQRAQQQIIYKLGTTKTHCLDTSGEVFAILLNLLYLVPLAYLFIRFFASYFDRSTQKGNRLQNARNAADRASKDVADEISEAMGDIQGGATEPPEELRAKLNNAKGDLRDKSQNLKNNAQAKAGDISGRVQDDLEKVRAKAQAGAKDIKAEAPEAISNAMDSVKKTGSAAVDGARGLKDSAMKKANASKGQTGGGDDHQTENVVIKEDVADGDVTDRADAATK